MIKKIIVFTILLSNIGRCALFSQQKRNYIASGYHQKIEEARLALLKEDTLSLYKLLSEIEMICPLLNFPTFCAMEHYVELSLYYGQYKQAYNYISQLVENYGYKIDCFRKMKNFKNLKSLDDWKYKYQVLCTAERKFVYDTITINAIRKLIEKDKHITRYYNIQKKKSKSEKVNVSQTLQPKQSEMKQIDTIASQMPLTCPIPQPQYSRDISDSIIFFEFIAIIQEKGFPLAPNIKCSPTEAFDLYFDVFSLVTHFSDTASLSILQPLLFRYIQEGKCPPELLAALVDTHQLNILEPPIYGITQSSIDDFKEVNLDEIEKRRKEIGLPSYQIMQEVVQKLKEKRDGYRAKSLF